MQCNAMQCNAMQCIQVISSAVECVESCWCSSDVVLSTARWRVRERREIHSLNFCLPLLIYLLRSISLCFYLSMLLSLSSPFSTYSLVPPRRRPCWWPQPSVQAHRHSPDEDPAHTWLCGQRDGHWRQNSGCVDLAPVASPQVHSFVGNDQLGTSTYSGEV